MRVNTPTPEEVQWLDHCITEEIFWPEEETCKPQVTKVLDLKSQIYFKISYLFKIITLF